MTRIHLMEAQHHRAGDDRAAAGMVDTPGGTSYLSRSSQAAEQAEHVANDMHPRPHSSSSISPNGAKDRENTFTSSSTRYSQGYSSSERVSVVRKGDGRVLGVDQCTTGEAFSRMSAVGLSGPSPRTSTVTAAAEAAVAAARAVAARATRISSSSSRPASASALVPPTAAAAVEARRHSLPFATEAVHSNGAAAALAVGRISSASASTSRPSSAPSASTTAAKAGGGYPGGYRRSVRSSSPAEETIRSSAAPLTAEAAGANGVLIGQGSFLTHTGKQVQVPHVTAAERMAAAVKRPSALSPSPPPAAAATTSGAAAGRLSAAAERSTGYATAAAASAGPSSDSFKSPSPAAAGDGSLGKVGLALRRSQQLQQESDHDQQPQPEQSISDRWKSQQQLQSNHRFADQQPQQQLQQGSSCGPSLKVDPGNSLRSLLRRSSGGLPMKTTAALAARQQTAAAAGDGGVGGAGAAAAIARARAASLRLQQQTQGVTAAAAAATAALEAAGGATQRQQQRPSSAGTAPRDAAAVAGVAEADNRARVADVTRSRVTGAAAVAAGSMRASGGPVAVAAADTLTGQGLHVQWGHVGQEGNWAAGKQSPRGGTLSAGVASTLANTGIAKAGVSAVAAAAPGGDGLIQSGRMDSIDRLTAQGAQQFYQKANRQLAGASLKLKLKASDYKGDSTQVAGKVAAAAVAALVGKIGGSPEGAGGVM